MAGKLLSISFVPVTFGKRCPPTAGRLRAGALVLAALVLAGCRDALPKQYEYDEVVDLSLDGSATVYVNGSVPALVALHGIDLDTRPNAPLDRDAVRRFYSSDAATVTRLNSSRRRGRRFVHLELEVPDIRQLSGTPGFRSTRFELAREGDDVVFRRSVGAPIGTRPDVPWDGSELVAFRAHLPSRIRYHNSPSKEIERGNILVWEQPLAARLRGEPIDMDARMAPESILYSTLWLFGSMIALAAFVFVAIIFLLVRRGRRQAEAR